jgi:glycosyltransferase involved in cell wall biosynthesis
MFPQIGHPALYAAFDVFPATKGAAVHIHHMAHTLFSVYHGGLLYVLGTDRLPRYQREAHIEIMRFSDPLPNFLERALAYGRRLQTLLAQQAGTLRLCHFRDPWSGIPILMHPARTYATVYEINGLPSIELPSAYPLLSQTTLEKIRAAEVMCWTEADSVITASQTMRQNLIALGAPEAKISVIPNGARLYPPPSRPSTAPCRYLIYCGALQSWQGIEVLLRAFAYLADLPDLHLVICAAVHSRQAKPYHKLAKKLGVSDRVRWNFQLSQEEVASWLAHAHLAVAPLTECARNLEQGCCPLKILEAMAAGVAVVASDLPSVRELITDCVHGRLVRPDRPAELARAMRILLEYPEQARAMANAARQRIAAQFTWHQSTERLAAHYRSLCAEPAPAEDACVHACQTLLGNPDQPQAEERIL